MENQNLQEKQQSYWTQSEAAQIVKVLSILINGQKTYGKDYSVSDTFAYYEMKLQNKFSAQQVLFAMDKYTDTKNDIPAPSDIINILNPAKPKISTADYIAARDNQRRNGYPQFSTDYMLIQEYEVQESDKQTEHKEVSNELTRLAGNSVKRIT